MGRSPIASTGDCCCSGREKGFRATTSRPIYRARTRCARNTVHTPPTTIYADNMAMARGLQVAPSPRTA